MAPALWTDEDVRSEGGETSGPATMAFKEYLAVAIQKGNAIVKEMMGVAGATVAFRKEYFAVKPLPMDAARLTEIEDLLDPELSWILNDVATFGVRAEVDGAPQRVDVPPHRSAKLQIVGMFLRAVEEFRMGVTSQLQFDSI